MTRFLEPDGEPARRIEILSREPVAGGFSDATKERVRIAVSDGRRRVERTAVMKRTSGVEVAALRAAGAVPAAGAIPPIIGSGTEERDTHWILIPFFHGGPAEAETRIPDNVIESLARLHVHYLDRQVSRRIPVVDARWWRAKCAQSAERLTALARPAASAIAEQVRNLADEPRILDALETLPRTLLHGDVHRNNVLVGRDGVGHLIDWGGAMVGIPALDIVNLGGPGSRGYRTYTAAWKSLTGRDLTDVTDLAWRHCHLVATVCINIKYVAFAAKVFGDADAESMAKDAADALAELKALHRSR